MRAAVYERYGPPEVMAVREVETPRPAAGEVLVRVHAASVNSWDWDQLIGNAMGRVTGPLRPRYRILGADVAGRVAAVGAEVEEFTIGDDVCGDLSEAGWGGFAEYVAVRAEVLVKKPAGLGFAEAAAVPQAGTLALQALRKRLPVAAGEAVLINGGGGGVGTFAIQLAKSMGAEVTAVDHGDKLALMRELGADHVLDYRQEDFTRGGRRYDRIIDPVARRSIAAYRRCLTPAGTVVVVGGGVSALLNLGLVGPLLSRRDGQAIGLLFWRPHIADIRYLLELCAAGTIRPAIDSVLPLAETGEALRRVGEGKALGKVVVAMPEQ
jgi:NADPH:quinone reductase-like Zn-dependent oxidoreductase